MLSYESNFLSCNVKVIFLCVKAGITAAPARAVSAVKNMNIPQQIKDMKLPDLPQAIKDLKFWPAVTSVSPSWLESPPITNTVYDPSLFQQLYTPIDGNENSPILPTVDDQVMSKFSRYQHWTSPFNIAIGIWNRIIIKSTKLSCDGISLEQWIIFIQWKAQISDLCLCQC